MSSEIKLSNDLSQAPALRTLIAAVQELSYSRTLEEVMAVVRRAARALVNADGATFILREGENCFYADEDAISPLWKGRRFPMTDCVSGWAMMNGKTAVIPDIYSDPRVPISAYRVTFVKSMVMVPIRPTSPLAAIGTYWKDNHRASAEEVELLQALANTTSVAMEDIRLQRELGQTKQPVAPAKQPVDDLQELYGRLLETHDRESRRVSRELHDSVGQTLVAAVLNLQRIQAMSPPTQISEVVEQSLVMMKQSLAEIRSIAHLLHPLLLDDLSLASTIRWYAQGFSERNKIPVDLQLAEDWETEALAPKVKTTIFRLVQESLLNVQKHAAASGVAIRFARNNGSVMLLIEDNGRGIPNPIHAGVGIQSMTQRVRQLGGQMKIDSDKSGTKIHVSLPR